MQTENILIHAKRKGGQKMHICAKAQICIFKNMHKYAFYVHYMLEYA